MTEHKRTRTAGSIKQPAGSTPLGRPFGSRAGQSLIMALSVLFLLIFLGTIFVTLIARNLESAVRAGDVLTARQMAEAGIDYANKMLTHSSEGADWRPVPDALPVAANASNPDIKWLRPWEPVESPTGGPTGGFTSFTSGSGRFLIRVSYTPDRRDPTSRYIKIESIGRSGVVDQNFQGSGTPDPTTLALSGPVRLRHELTAYKPIGITDYARFVTNKQKRAEFFSFGKAIGGGRMVFGGDFGASRRTGPIRVNGNLLWRGNVDIVLDGSEAQAPGGSRVPLPVDRVEISGEVEHEPNAEVVVRRFISGAESSEEVNPSRGSGADAFTTLQGFYRDGSDVPEQLKDGDWKYAGNARAIKRLEPPLIDQEDPSSGTTRYRRLTLQSGRYARMDGGRYANTGRYGWGAGMYIDNRADAQQEGSSLFGGGRTLKSEWLHPNNQLNWQGAHYVPPGVVITLKPDRTMRITRTDAVRRNQSYVWTTYDATTNALTSQPGFGPTIESMPYPENGVIFAEGNIRIKGMVAADSQLTIVSNENIYIEGNILKQDEFTSAVALLARKNVVLNTTMFMGLAPLSSAGWESIAGGGEPPYTVRVSASPSSNYLAAITFGRWYALGQPIRTAEDYPGIRMFVRHAADANTAIINLFVNRAPYLGFPAPPLAPGPPGPWGFYMLADAATQYAPSFEAQVFDMQTGANGPAVDVLPGRSNFFEFALAQAGAPQARGDYLLSAAAILPLDINVQALCYAQEGSFFVIPGVWFNESVEDTPNNATARGGRPPYIKHPAFPFYGEPLDIKITVDGAIAENLPASDSDVDAWLRHWSNIPAEYGSSSEPTVHAGDGLTFLYDANWAFPVNGPDGAVRREVPRGSEPDPAYGPGSDPARKLGRPLPLAPRLPVSPDLLYVGRLSS